MTALNVIIALGAAGALVGIVQYAALGFDDDNHRPRGTLSHYMTYSGVLMLVTCAAAASLIFYREGVDLAGDRRPGPAGRARLHGVAQRVGRHRHRDRRAAGDPQPAACCFVAPVAAALVLLVAPGLVKQRAYSIVNPHDATNRDRIAMIKSGVHMVKDHPLFGVGPEHGAAASTRSTAARRRRSRGRRRRADTRASAQCADSARRGARRCRLSSAWLWFVVVAGRDLFRQLYRGPAKAVAGAGAAALVAMLAAGLFEHNFGDSEFLTLFLGIITLPYAARPGDVPQAAGLTVLSG